MTTKENARWQAGAKRLSSALNSTATILRVTLPPRREPDICRGCGERQAQPLDHKWPWCPTCELRWRVENAGRRGRVPPPRRRS